MTRPTLLFVHGWAFDAAFWRPLCAALSDWPHAVAELGYYAQAAGAAGVTDVASPRLAASHEIGASGADGAGAPSWPDVAGPVVAIGHSYGVARLLQVMPANGYAGLIGINGFARFAAADDFPEGVPARLLDRMIARLARQPAEVVNDFRLRCGAPPRPDAGANAALAASLDAMRHADHREALQGLACPWLALAAEDDAIVTPAMTRAQFADSHTTWRADGGHLLPLTRTAWCAEQIQPWLDALASTVTGSAKDAP
jgi:pimeloyl-[acyl-carrier protein] methyl ester esterase